MSLSLCHEAGASLCRTKQARRLSEPRDERGEFRRARPVRRCAGEPGELVARVLSFGSVFFHGKENERPSKMIDQINETAPVSLQEGTI
jgi:hypothetical protein